MKDIPRIKPADVKRLLDNGQPVRFIDTRNPTAWAESNTRLPGAIRVEADQVDEHLVELNRAATIVAYCT